MREPRPRLRLIFLRSFFAYRRRLIGVLVFWLSRRFWQLSGLLPLLGPVLFQLAHVLVFHGIRLPHLACGRQCSSTSILPDTHDGSNLRPSWQRYACKGNYVAPICLSARTEHAYTMRLCNKKRGCSDIRLLPMRLIRLRPTMQSEELVSKAMCKTCNTLEDQCKR